MHRSGCCIVADRATAFALAFAAGSALCAGAAAVQAGVIYVNHKAEPGGDGRSWATAFDDLHDGLAAAIEGDEIWVARGEYRPAPRGGDRAATFALVTGVALYGGFRADELTRDERDPARYVTTLSGDLNGDDQPGFVNYGENSHHVVTIARSVTGTRVDGFVIAHGSAQPYPIAQWGGGMFVDRGGHVDIAICELRDNYAEGSAAAVHLEDRSRVRMTDGSVHHNGTVSYGLGAAFQLRGGRLELERCVVRDHGPIQGGGAIFGHGGELIIRDSLFERNTADFGGAMWLGKVELTIERSVFRDNAALRSDGGALHMFGQRHDIRNTLFEENRADERGGAVLFETPGSLVVVNSTFVNNAAVEGAGGLHVATLDGPVTITSSLFRGNVGAGDLEQQQVNASRPQIFTIDYSNVEGWTGNLDGEGSFDREPRFVDAEADFRVRAGSRCIDAGDNTALMGDPFDLLGLPRMVDDPNTPDTGRGQPPLVDVGAYEFQADRCTGRERMRAKCKPGDGDQVIVVKLKKGMADQPITFRLDDDPTTDIAESTDGQGRLKAKLKHVAAGPHRVIAVECPASVGVDCS